VSPHHLSQSRALSRRSILKRGAVAAVAGATAPVFNGWAGPLASDATAAALPTVTPKWSQLAVQSFGVCAMPLHDKSVYHHRSAWIANLASMGVHSIRSFYEAGFAPTYETVNLLRQRGMKWGVIAIDEDELQAPDARIVARVNDIANRAADVCLYVEGINEPNHNRDGSRVLSNWRELTLQKQKVLWQAVQARPELRGRVAVVGPSLQMNEVTEADYKWFAAHGLLNYMTHAGSHAYSGGRYPDRKFATQLQPMLRHWKKPAWITETGYTNSLAGPTGPSPIPEWAAGVYAPSALLEAVDRNWKVTWFEVLDDPDAGVKSVTEANYGLFALEGTRMAPPWRAKPAAVALRSMLTGLKDPGPAYRPAPIGLRVSAPVADVRWTALGKRNGSVRVYLRRAAEVYDARTNRALSVPKVTVTIATAKGIRAVPVGAEVVSVLV
jgi:hypothetical protein